MRRRIVIYIVSVVLLVVVLVFFNTAYKALATDSELTNRHNKVLNNFQTLLRQINNAAVLHPDLIKASKAGTEAELFYTDSLAILAELNTLKATVRDSVNIRLAAKVDPLIKTEIAWLISSNVPDSIIHKKAETHIEAFKEISSLLRAGIQRTNTLVEYRKLKLNNEIEKVRSIILLFVILSGLMLIYTTVNLSKQQSKTKKKELELEIVLNRINDGVVSVDNNWNYTFLNDAALAAHPLGKKGTLGKSLWEVHPGLEGTEFGDKYRQAMLTKKTQEINNYYAPLNTWFSVKVYPSGDGLTIFFKDVTESKKSEQKLTETLKEISDYKYALEESAIVAITDQKGIIKYANDNFCKISKYSLEELIGQDHRIINSGYHPKQFIKGIWTTIANGKIWKGEIKNKAKDGTVYWVDTTIVPLLDDKGKPYQYLAIRADITERKKAEEQIIHLNTELEGKVILRTEELQAANNEMEAFTYSVSHDLRAPLRGIIGFTAILEEDYSSKLDDEAKRITSVIRENTMKMGHLIDDLLDFSRMGKRELSKAGIDTNMLVKGIIDDLVQQNKVNQIEWHIPALPVVEGDISMIRQVWINLLSNAVKYSSTKTKSRIEVNSFRGDGQICFSIKDNGVGFDEQYRHNLFKVFQRLHDQEEFEGTGVGLALVEKIISRHGGRVWAEGKEDEGATFYFSLPV